MGFEFKRVKPGVASEMIYDDEIVFAVINRNHRGCP